MIIGLIGAIPEEIEIIKTIMCDVDIISHGGRTFYKGTLGKQEIVLVHSMIGKVAAALTVTSLITYFNVKKIIFTGVAGAASDELNIGDIVISDKLYQYDMDASPLWEKHEVPLTEKTYFESCPKLIEKAEAAAKQFLAILDKKIPIATQQKFNINNPKYCIGTIATGDQFINDKNFIKNILQDKKETLAIEMEGAAVAQVCEAFQIPLVVIRIISDKADHHATFNFPSFVNEVTKYYTLHLIKNIFY